MHRNKTNIHNSSVLFEKTRKEIQSVKSGKKYYDFTKLEGTPMRIPDVTYMKAIHICKAYKN